jgi:hypothetical protein
LLHQIAPLVLAYNERCPGESPNSISLSQYITACGEKRKGVFSTQIPAPFTMQMVNNFLHDLACTSREFPAQVSADADIAQYTADLIPQSHHMHRVSLSNCQFTTCS